MLHLQTQEYKGKNYGVTDLIEISKDIKPIDIKTETIYTWYNMLPSSYGIRDIVELVERVNNADMNYPILMYQGFIMDGKHRLTKALLEGRKTVKVKVLTELPVPLG